MANTLLLKRQSTANAIPTTGQLSLGELAVNSRDGTLFLKRNDGTTDQIVKVWTDRQLTNTSQLTNDSNFLTSTQATTTIGSGITGPIFLNISNPGIGNASGFNFIKANDSAGLQVTETTADQTLYEFFMSDNPDGVQIVQTNTTAVRSVTYVLTAAVNITLPASPAVGDWVIIVNASGAITPVVLRNGSRIMSLLEDFTINSKNASLKFTYTDSTRGWVIQ